MQFIARSERIEHDYLGVIEADSMLEAAAKAEKLSRRRGDKTSVFIMELPGTSEGWQSFQEHGAPPLTRSSLETCLFLSCLIHGIS